MRHEEAAGAEAHLTGSLAVCAGSYGSGNLHLINVAPAHLPRFVIYNGLNAWGKHREVPHPPKQTFHSCCRQNRGGEK